MAERKIGNNTFKVEPLKAVPSLMLLTRVTKLIGPALPYIDAAFEATDIQQRNAAGLRALAAAVKEADELKVIELITDVCGTAAIKKSGGYEPLEFDVDFIGDLASAFQLFLFVMEVNFKSFFDVGKGTIGAGLTNGFQNRSSAA